MTINVEEAAKEKQVWYMFTTTRTAFLTCFLPDPVPEVDGHNKCFYSGYTKGTSEKHCLSLQKRSIRSKAQSAISSQCATCYNILPCYSTLTAELCYEFAVLEGNTETQI